MDQYSLACLYQGSDENEADSHGTPSTGTNDKKIQSLFSDVAGTRDLPTIEFIIIHHDFNHKQSKDDSISCAYIPCNSSEKVPIDVGDSSKPVQNSDEFITINDGSNVIQLRKSVVNEYRRNSQYYGPLKAEVERVKIVNDGHEREVTRTKLVQVRFLVKDSVDGQSPSNDELQQAMAQIPGLIMPCDPADVLSNESVFPQISINFGDNEIVNVSKKAVDTYRKLSSVQGSLKAQREKCYMQLNEKTVAVSKIRLFPEKAMQVKVENSVFPEEVENNEKTLPIFPKKGIQVKVETSVATEEVDKSKNNLPFKRKRGRPRKQLQQEDVYCTYKNSVNGGQSIDSDAELQLDELEQELNRSRKIKNIPKSQWPVEDFVCLQEIAQQENNTALGDDSGVVILPCVEDLDDLSLSNGNIESYIQAEPEENDLSKIKPNFPLSESMTNQKLWMYIMDCATSDPNLDVSSYTIEKKNWLEIKKRQEYLEIDYEVVPGITVKTLQDGSSEIRYFIRSHGRLINKGTFTSAEDVNLIFQCLFEDRKTCLGINPTCYLQIMKNNEQLKNITKNKGKYIFSPFEGLFSNSCYGIVRVNPKAPSTRFKRGAQTIFGIQARCTMCCKLKLQLDQETNRSAGKSSDMKETLEERMFLQSSICYSSYSPGKNKTNRILSHTGGSINNVLTSPSNQRQRPQKKRLQSNKETSDKSGSNISISEDEFIGMIGLEKASSEMVSQTLVKCCKVCQYRASSMLALFTHMQGHIGSLPELFSDCEITLSNKEAIVVQRKQMPTERSPFCTVCNMDFTTRDQLFDHMNKHRKHHPFQCTFCDHKLTNMDAFKKHVRISHKIKSVKELKLNCKTCNIHFYTSDQLLLHRVNQNHEDIDQFVCKFCRFVCSTANDFRSHVWEHSEDDREACNMVICAHCHKVFFSTFRLNYHIEIKHTKKKPKEVEKVSDISVNTALLLESEKKKKNKGPYLRYLRANSKYECKKCRRRFKTQETLDNHDRFSHGGKKSRMIKPQFLRTECECSLCGRKFNGLRKLATHMKIHAGNKPVFQCEECGQIYGKKLQVLEHIRNDHAEQVQRHQEQQQQSGLVTCGPPEEIIEIRGAQLPLGVSASGTVSLPSGTGVSLGPTAAVLEGSAPGGSSASWSPIKSPFKVPSVEQTQEAVYSLLQLTDF